MTTNNGRAGIREVYELISDLRIENNKRFDKVEIMFASFHKEEFVPMDKFVERLKAYGAVSMIVFNLTIFFIAEWVKRTFLKG